MGEFLEWTRRLRIFLSSVKATRKPHSLVYPMLSARLLPAQSLLRELRLVRMKPMHGKESKPVLALTRLNALFSRNLLVLKATSLASFLRN